MRVKRTIMVEKEVTTCSCDIKGCTFTTDHNRGYCGSSPIISCYFCGKDCCRDHREVFSEYGHDFPYVVICSDCLPKGKHAWEIALDIAGRNDVMAEVAKKVFENQDEYQEEFAELSEIEARSIER